MRVFDVKSVILGIGIGIIFTSIICMIYLFGVKPEQLSESEIKQLAKQYGMVERDSGYQEKKTPEQDSETTKGSE